MNGEVESLGIEEQVIVLVQNKRNLDMSSVGNFIFQSFHADFLLLHKNKTTIKVRNFFNPTICPDLIVSQ